MTFLQDIALDLTLFSETRVHWMFWYLRPTSCTKGCSFQQKTLRYPNWHQLKFRLVQNLRMGTHRPLKLWRSNKCFHLNRKKYDKLLDLGQTKPLRQTSKRFQWKRARAQRRSDGCKACRWGENADFPWFSHDPIRGLCWSQVTMSSCRQPCRLGPEATQKQVRRAASHQQLADTGAAAGFDG
jgi:hypothetical protein